VATGERDVKALREKRDVYQRGTREFEKVAEQVRDAESALKAAASALASREKELAPLLAAQKQATMAGDDVVKLGAASGAMYAFVRSAVKTDAFQDAAYAVDAMAETLKQIQSVETGRARALAAERATQATALVALKKEVLDASRKQIAVEQEVVRLNKQMRETTRRLEEVEQSEGKDVAQAVALYEKTVRPPPPPQPAPKPTAKPTPKPEEKPARRRVFSRGGGTRESVVDAVWNEYGLERAGDE
jgi:septal ring factor EnvC (AmiA/AmiB activator)